MASYPGAIKSFAKETNQVTLADADDFNVVTDEVTAIETELGADVATSLVTAFTDLNARLNSNTQVIDRNMATVNVGNTANETTVYSFSVPANTLSNNWQKVRAYRKN